MINAIEKLIQVKDNVKVIYIGGVDLARPVVSCSDR